MPPCSFCENAPDPDEPEALISFSAPRKLSTRNGERNLRISKMPPDHPGWKVWRTDKELVKRLHFGVAREYQGQGWEMQHWDIPGKSSTFDADFANLLLALDDADAADARAKEAQKIDWVAEDAAPLVTDAAGKLFGWQRPSCQRIVGALSTGNALDASQTGAGKTFVALAACAELGLSPYVVAPLAVLESWKRAAAFMGVPLAGVVNYDKARNGKVPFIKMDGSGSSANFTFTPMPSSVRPVLILDEVQKCKNPDSLQGRILTGCAMRGAKVLCLSATAAKDPTEMCGIGVALGLHGGGKSFAEWAKRHGCRGGNGKGMWFTTNVKAAADIMGRIHRMIFPARGTRIRSADVPDYPDNLVSAHLVSNEAIVDAYEELMESMEEVAAKKEAGDLDGREAKAQGLAAITLARRKSEFGKLDFMIDEVKELIADGNQVAVFLNFREHLAVMRDGLKLKTQPVWGTAWMGKYQDDEGRFHDIDGPAQKPEERTRIIDDFQSGAAKVILVSLMAGGAGISLHDDKGIAPRQSLISPSYSAIDLVQAIGRIWRAGSHSKATQRIIYAAGTIEEEIAASVTAKIQNIETLNDGDVLPDCLARFTGVEE